MSFNDHVVIIGNGIAGITTALEFRKLNPKARVTIVSAETPYFYSRPALMYIFMGHMELSHTQPYPKNFWKKQKLDLVFDRVTSIDGTEKKLTLQEGGELAWDKLVLATGSKSNKFGWPGQDLDGVQGLYDLQDLELLEKNIVGVSKAVIVGGGLIGVELAEMLHMRGIHVSFLIREGAYWSNVLPIEESEMIGELIEKEGFQLIKSTNLKEIVDDGNGRVCAITTEFDQRIDCGFVGLTPGVSPNLLLAEGSNIPTKRGYTVNPFLESGREDVFACGDCAEVVQEDGSSRVWPLWYTGKIQGEALAKTLNGDRTRFEMGTFYNSAKFLDLEYQTYGEVFPNRENETHYFWRNAEGNKSIRLVEKEGALIGVNVFGIRYRQNVCHQWIEAKLPITKVLEELPKANFDPEFSKKYEPEAVSQFRKQLQG